MANSHLRNLCLGMLLSLSLANPAISAISTSNDTELDLHVQKITKEMRCLVCQNQTIADSQAQLALDLKNQVRVQLAQQKSDQEIIDFMVQRYGDYILYRPPFKQVTLVLWLGPFLLLLAGLLFLYKKLRRANPAIETYSEADRQRAALLLTESQIK